MKCPKCGFESQSKFCPECGTPMQSPPQPAPDQSIPPTPTPTPYGQPPLNPTNNNPAKRVSPPPRGRKPTVIVIAIIVALVVLAGIVIAVGSGIFYHKTLINATTERNKPDIIEQPYDYQTNTEPDYYFNSLYQPGEPFDFSYGTLTLTSVTNKDGDYTFSGELLNSTLLPQSYIIKDIRMSANHTPDFTIQFDKKRGTEKSTTPRNFYWNRAKRRPLHSPRKVRRKAEKPIFPSTFNSTTMKACSPMRRSPTSSKKRILKSKIKGSRNSGAFGAYCNQISSITAISAPSPRRGPILVTLV